MKNADMPAMPTTTYDFNAAMNGVGVSVTEFAGLTKREEFASRNFAALLSALPHWESLGYAIPDGSEIARQALSGADALLAELEK